MDLLSMLRMKNIYGTPQDFTPPEEMYGNDLPSQGGFTGQMPDTTGSPMPQQAPLYQGPPPPLPSTPFKWSPPGSPGYTEEPPMFPEQREPRQTGIHPIAQGMLNAFTPETEATDRYNQMVQNYPNREDEQYKPGFWRSLGSAVVDYTKGPAEGRRFYDEKFNEAQEDWKNQIGPAGQAANLERYQNVNERTLTYQTASIAAREEAQQARETNDIRKAEIAERRAETYDFARRNNWQVIPTKGGNIMLKNTATGETHDTGVPTGTLTVMEKLQIDEMNKVSNMQEQNRLNKERDAANNQSRKEIAQMREGETFNTVDADGKVTGTVRIEGGKAVPVQGIDSGGIARPSSTGGGQKAETPSAKRLRQYNTADQIKNEHPEVAEFLTLDPASKEITLTEPQKPGYFGNVDDYQEKLKLYNDLANAIYGESPHMEGIPDVGRKNKNIGLPREGGGTTTPSQTPSQGGGLKGRYQKNSKTGEVRVSYDDGKTWTVVSGGK